MLSLSSSGNQSYISWDMSEAPVTLVTKKMGGEACSGHVRLSWASSDWNYQIPWTLSVASQTLCYHSAKLATELTSIITVGSASSHHSPPPCECLSAREKNTMWSRTLYFGTEPGSLFPSAFSLHAHLSKPSPGSSFMVYTKYFYSMFWYEIHSVQCSHKNVFKWNKIISSVTSPNVWSARDVCLLLCWTTVMAHSQVLKVIQGFWPCVSVPAMLAQSTHLLDTFHLTAQFMLWHLACIVLIYSHFRLSCGFNLWCPPPMSTVPAAGCQRQLVFRSSVFIFWWVFLYQ